MLKTLAAAALVMGLMSSAAMAQSLENVQGRVQVDRGSGFTDSGAGPVKAGDVIKVVGNGTVDVNYGGGVVIPVKSGQSYTISKVYGQGASGNPTERDARRLALGLAVAAAVGCAVVCRDGNDGQVFLSP